MYWPLIVALFVIAVCCLFVWLNRHAKKEHAAFIRSDVISAIQNVLSDTDCDHDEWDMFLSWPIDDPYLESIRQRCIAISSEYSGKERGKDIATGGEVELQLILDELEQGAESEC